jgi:antitoxin CcdA
MERATFSIDSEAASFLRKAAGKNRSAYINRLLKEEKRRMLEQKILAANREEAEDPSYMQEIALWDATLGDGLADE